MTYNKFFPIAFITWLGVLLHLPQPGAAQAGRDYHFIPNSEIVESPADTFRAVGINWGEKAIVGHLKYLPGTIETLKGNRVQAYMLISQTYELVNKYHPDQPVVQDTELLASLKLDGHFNCFSYCLIDSKYWIEDPMPFLQDEFDSCSEAEATLGILEQCNGVGDDGHWTYTPIHAYKIIDGKIDYKPGLFPLEMDKSEGLAADEYNFNRILYFKPKRR